MLKRDFRGAGAGRHVFETKIGPVGLVWSPGGVRRVFFGPAGAEAVEAELSAAYPDISRAKPVPDPVREAARRLKAHLAGRLDPLQDIPISCEDRGGFAQAVYQALRSVPPGQVVTYGELAARAGRPGAARSIGRILGANPVPLLVPCHRCVGADGSMTGFSVEGGLQLKRKLLFGEGWEPNEDYRRGIAHLRRRDPVMRKLIDHGGPYAPLPDKPLPPYDTLVQAIIHQQLSVKAGRTIAQRVRDLTPGPRFPTPGQMLALDDATLRSVGLSGQKTAYVKDLAARVADGRLKLNRLKNLDDDAVIAELTTVKGIGVWSAHMHLIFHLDRLDVLPVGDLGIQIACGRFYDLGQYATPAQITALGEKWRPYRSMAAWYLWRGLDSGGL